MLHMLSATLIVTPGERSRRCGRARPRTARSRRWRGGCLRAPWCAAGRGLVGGCQPDRSDWPLRIRACMAAKPRRRCRETARSYGGCTHPNRPARRTPPMTTSSVSATGLVKAFGEFRAVDRIDLEVRQGEIFGVLGPNGAGKTTMLRMLATLLPIA